MTSAWLVGAHRSMPQDQTSVRSTIEPVRTDGPAELNEAPEWNEFNADTSGALTGISHRTLGSDVHESKQYKPFWSWLAGQNHNVIIDDQISESGTAAAREEAGVQGHGTMEYAVGIEPVIRPGAAFSTDYFTSNPLEVQEGSGDYMTTPVVDNQWAAVAQQIAVSRSRKSYAGLYENFRD
jgi:hypothetical protein